MFQQATYQTPEELGEPQKLRTEQAIIFSFNATNAFVEPGPQKYYFYLLRYNLHAAKCLDMKCRVHRVWTYDIITKINI